MVGLIAEEIIMEAERLNSLSALLADLTTREAELRRYL
jgi:peptide chain release factor 2